MKRILLLLISSLLLASCASKTTDGGGGGGWFGFGKTQGRSYEVETLPNGLKVYFVRDETFPEVAITLQVRAGSRQDPQDFEGVNSLTAGLLDKGTVSKKATELSEELNRYGTEFYSNSSGDVTTFSTSSLTRDAVPVLNLFAEILLNPAFNEKELDRLRDQTKASLKKRMDNPGAYTAFLYRDYYYANHSFSRDPLGTEASLDRIHRADVIRHYLNWVRPNISVLVVTGRYDDSFRNDVRTAFGKWNRRDLTVQEPEAFPHWQTLQMRLASKNALAQTQIRMGVKSIPRNSPDYEAMMVASEVLGGGFASRLMQKIRDDLGLTYSVSSYQNSGKYNGVFGVSTFTKNESVGQTVAEILKVYRRFIQDGITETELDMAKAQILGQYPRSMETAQQYANILLGLDYYGLPVSEIEDYPRRVAKLSVKDVNAVIRKNLTSDAFKILIYGDEKKIAAQLKDWNPEVVRIVVASANTTAAPPPPAPAQ